VTLPQQPRANDVIGNTILELGAQGVSAVPYVPPVSPGSAPYLVRSTGEKLLIAEEHAESTKKSAPQAEVHIARYPLQVMGKQILVETPLVGRHQLRNVALAIATAEVLSHQGFAITPAAIERGIRETRWPGRFQVMAAGVGAPEYVFDVAHNPAGAWALRSTLSACYEDRPLTFVFGAMRDKAIGEMAEILFPLAVRVIATRADNPRSATPDEIREAAARTATDIEDAIDVASALDRARSLAGPQGVVVITGSIYIVGEAMRILGVRV
jgi:dihydrofolate synthase/folylpolyglutamate synthase